MILKNLKEFRSRIAAHDITLWEGLPLLLAFVVPNILEPAWVWRLISTFGASLSLTVIAIHALLAPEQFYKAGYSQLPRSKKVIFWMAYLATIVGLPLILFFAVIPTGGDLYRVIKNPDRDLEEKTVEFIKTEGGGSVSPYFVIQTLISDENTYRLPFSAHAWGQGTHKVIYSPHTNIVYEVIQVR